MDSHCRGNLVGGAGPALFYTVQMPEIGPLKIWERRTYVSRKPRRLSMLGPRVRSIVVLEQPRVNLGWMRHGS